MGLIPGFLESLVCVPWVESLGSLVIKYKSWICVVLIKLLSKAFACQDFVYEFKTHSQGVGMRLSKVKVLFSAAVASTWV